MNKNEEVRDRMREIAFKFHAGQTRRDGVTPYINHIEDVAKRVRLANKFATLESNLDAQAVAFGHDLFEDTDCTVDYLQSKNIPEYIINWILKLTRKKDQSYEDFIDQIINSSPEVKVVKIADILSNLSDKPSEKQILKYIPALSKLLGYENF